MLRYGLILLRVIIWSPVVLLRFPCNVLWLYYSIMSLSYDFMCAPGVLFYGIVRLSYVVHMISVVGLWYPVVVLCCCADHALCLYIILYGFPVISCCCSMVFCNYIVCVIWLHVVCLLYHVVIIIMLTWLVVVCSWVRCGDYVSFLTFIVVSIYHVVILWLACGFLCCCCL